MTDLIDDLKREHAEITEALNSLGCQRLGSDADIGIWRMMALEHALAVHLRLEDERLYPVLREAARTDLSVRQAMVNFAEDLLALAVSANKFFDTYARGDGLDFAHDLGRLSNLIVDRFGREEQVLYPMYGSLPKLMRWTGLSRQRNGLV